MYQSSARAATNATRKVCLVARATTKASRAGCRLEFPALRGLWATSTVRIGRCHLEARITERERWSEGIRRQLWPNLGPQVAGEQLAGDVRVLHRPPRQDTHERPDERSEDQAVPWVVTPAAVAQNQGLAFADSPEPTQLRGWDLVVGVQVPDPTSRSFVESADQRGPVALVGYLVQNPHRRQFASKGIDGDAGCVGGSVVHDDHLTRAGASSSTSADTSRTTFSIDGSLYTGSTTESSITRAPRDRPRRFCARYRFPS